MPAPTKIRFDVHPAVKMMENWLKALPERTGRSLAQWVKLIKKEGPGNEAAARTWLKDRYELGTNSAWWLAERAFARDPSQWDDNPETYLALAHKYLQGQYGGKKQPLQPIFERLYKLSRALGKDVKVCPCKTMVPLYREHVFAEIKPTTITRVDLGLCLTPLLRQKKKLPARLIDTGGFAKKNRITTRIPISHVEEINGFVEQWLQRAYGLAADA